VTEPDPTAPADPVVTPLGGQRRTIARRMTEAWQAPVFHLSVTVDATGLIARRGERPDVTITDLLVADCGRALLAHPALNSHLVEDELRTFAAAHVALAVATDRGLAVPVLRDAGTATPEDLARQRRDLVERARAGKLRAADVAGATFTVSNLGMFGTERFDAILNPPQVAILAVGAIRDAAVVRDGAIVVAPVVELCLTSDHRAVDGAQAAAFARTLRELLERG
jgi:pyruvate dehydrogenase E2 component (dihydrolipoamide acetyltransferase)